MELFVADAFTTRRFSGNQAGVALLGRRISRRRGSCGPWPGS
ncbi:MAG: hypothetical protein ACLRNQ_22125 [Flavonifractor plautii]